MNKHKKLLLLSLALAIYTPCSFNMEAPRPASASSNEAITLTFDTEDQKNYLTLLPPELQIKLLEFLATTKWSVFNIRGFLQSIEKNGHEEFVKKALILLSDNNWKRIAAALGLGSSLALKISLQNNPDVPRLLRASLRAGAITTQAAIATLVLSKGTKGLYNFLKKWGVKNWGNNIIYPNMIISPGDPPYAKLTDNPIFSTDTCQIYALTNNENIGFVGLGTLEFVPSDSEECDYLEVRGPSYLQHHTFVITDKNKINIRIYRNRNWTPKDISQIKLIFHLKSLQSLTITATGDITLDAMNLKIDSISLKTRSTGSKCNCAINAQQFVAVISDTTAINLSGNTHTQKITISGICHYDASNCLSEYCLLKISGIADLILNSKEIEGRITGIVNSLKYSNNEKINLAVTGILNNAPKDFKTKTKAKL